MFLLQRTFLELECLLEETRLKTTIATTVECYCRLDISFLKGNDVLSEDKVWGAIFLLRKCTVGTEKLDLL